jgi:hypothetical protein
MLRVQVAGHNQTDRDKVLRALAGEASERKRHLGWVLEDP